ncbi:glycosyltransferase family 2 protein [Gimesia fumaroli]|uniref:Glycosyl transferase family 2 n=1 Tax=Gimesia fumaroli TaxID=2527976 RepID=A0A518IJL4_9PLAN|nr:glycosyltransferase family 2 protein [Gimesia fumaroli]QDV53283.1 Glycosyl transferase family 2 [Gimesia fumaroli]
MIAECLAVEILLPDTPRAGQTEDISDRCADLELSTAIVEVLESIACLSRGETGAESTGSHQSRTVYSELCKWLPREQIQKSQCQLRLNLKGNLLTRHERLAELLELTGCQLEIYLQNTLPDFQAKYRQIQKLIERWQRSYDLDVSVQVLGNTAMSDDSKSLFRIGRPVDLSETGTLYFQYRDGSIQKADQTRSSQPVKRIHRSPQVVSADYDIDIFVPYFRNLQLVPQTIDSILWQAGVKPFIHLVNDCSREDDRPLFERYRHLDNVAWYKTKRNCGPYAIANSLFYHMKTAFIGIADSDDIYLPWHFATAISDIKEHHAQAWGSIMSQFLNPLESHLPRNVALPKNHPIADSGKNVGLPYPRLVNGTMVVRRDTFEALNGFNGNWHCAADTEFSQRVQFPSDANAEFEKTVHFSGETTALRRVCSNSLSNSDGRFGLKSPERDAIKAESIRRYELWKTQEKIEPRQYGTLDSQEDVLDSDYRISTARDSKVYACLTSIPRRVYALEKTIASLVDQVDGIKVHLNDYQFLPPFLKNPKIEVVHGDNSLMSCTKFLWADRLDGYILTCDDDLIYPPDYVERMRSAIDKYKCIACAHGSKLKPGIIDSYYKDRTVYDARLKVRETTFIDVPGTGVMGWHTDDVKLSMTDFDLPGMEDIAAYRAIYQHSYMAVVVAHPDGWFKSSTHKNDGGLYSESVRNDSKETEVINANKNHRV